MGALVRAEARTLRMFGFPDFYGGSIGAAEAVPFQSTRQCADCFPVRRDVYHRLASIAVPILRHLLQEICP